MRLMSCALMVVVALSLSGCGKRARYLDPPDTGAKHEKYPKVYPPPDSAGTHL